MNDLFYLSIFLLVLKQVKKAVWQKDSSGEEGIFIVCDISGVKPFISKKRKTTRNKVFYRMKDISASGLKQADLQHLLSTPEADLLGEIIRLNHTIYSNTLDVIKVCSVIRKKRKRVA